MFKLLIGIKSAQHREFAGCRQRRRRGAGRVEFEPRAFCDFVRAGGRMPRFEREKTIAALEYRDQGFLPEALLNYLARLGWSHGDAEVFSQKEFVAWFDLDHITSSAAQFDYAKLGWLNGQYLKQADPAALARQIASTQLAVWLDDAPSAAAAASTSVIVDP